MVSEMLLGLRDACALGKDDPLWRSRLADDSPLSLHAAIVVILHRSSPEMYDLHVVQDQPRRCQSVDTDEISPADHILVALEDGQEVAIRRLSSHASFLSFFSPYQIQLMLSQVHWYASEGIIKPKSRYNSKISCTGFSPRFLLFTVGLPLATMLHRKSLDKLESNLMIFVWDKFNVAFC
jgi:hypothetical protein